MGTNPRNTLDTKAKYEHYFRKDVDVSLFLFIVRYKLSR